ncbi:MAG: CopG family transcriptional regulator [Selenomonadaceae bacterium]|nr:CopG family transcriptional regulator [Selenomonadaceae bacterium]
MALITVNLNDEALKVLEECAERKDISVSEFIRRAVLEKLEDEEDIRAADEAYAEYLKNPVTYSLEEIKAELGLNEIVHGEDIACCSQETEEDGLSSSGAYSKLA